MNLRDALGPAIYNDLTPHQHQLVSQAADEAPDGLRKLADEIRQRGSNISSPVAVLLNRIQRGQHEERQRAIESQNHAGPNRTTPADAFRRLYHAKMRELRDVTTWTQGEMTEYAIDYAASYTDRCQVSPYPPGHNIITIENDLRREIGAPRYA